MKRGSSNKSDLYFQTFSSEPPPMDEVPMNSDEPTSDFINETVAPPPFDEEDNGDGISFSQADLQAISRSRLLSPIQNRTADHGSDSSLSASTGVSYSSYVRRLMFSRR